MFMDVILEGFMREAFAWKAFNYYHLNKSIVWVLSADKDLYSRKELRRKLRKRVKKGGENTEVVNYNMFGNLCYLLYWNHVNIHLSISL